jgi:TrmH family RNA methyltransferase
MLSKNELKYIQSLCQKKQRQAEGLFIAEGTKLAEELLKSHYRIRKIYATAGWEPPVTPKEPVITITEGELERVSSLQTPNKVLIIAEQPLKTPAPLLTKGLTLLLDGIQDPGNLGTLIRIADWFGIKQIIAGEHTAELYNPKVIQSTMGSFIRVNVTYQSLEEVLISCKLPVYGALLKGENVNKIKPVTDGLLIIGNESKGISHELLSSITHPVTIPRIGGAESLNAAVAAGIILSRMIE